MSRLIEAAEGWFNFITSTKGHKEVALSRLAICDKCPHKLELNYLAAAVLSVAKPGSSTYKCGKCGCPLSAKVLSMESQCPDDRW